MENEELDCVCCKQKFNTNEMEYDTSFVKNGKIHMCEECLDYSGYTICHFENKMRQATAYFYCAKSVPTIYAGKVGATIYYLIIIQILSNYYIVLYAVVCYSIYSLGG